VRGGQEEVERRGHKSLGLVVRAEGGSRREQRRGE